MWDENAHPMTSQFKGILAKPSVTWTGPALAEVMALHQARKNIDWLSIRASEADFVSIWIQLQDFCHRKCAWKCGLQNGGYYVLS